MSKKLLLLILLLSFLFYWFQIRPTNIRSECARKIGNANVEGATLAMHESAYQICLHLKGL